MPHERSTDPTFPTKEICKRQQTVEPHARRAGAAGAAGASLPFADTGHLPIKVSGHFKPGDQTEPGNAIPNIAWANSSKPLG